MIFYIEPKKKNAVLIAKPELSKFLHVIKKLSWNVKLAVKQHCTEDTASLDPLLAPSNCVKRDKLIFKDSVGALRAALGLRALPALCHPVGPGCPSPNRLHGGADLIHCTTLPTCPPAAAPFLLLTGRIGAKPGDAGWVADDVQWDKRASPMFAEGGQEWQTRWDHTKCFGGVWEESRHLLVSNWRKLAWKARGLDWKLQ